MDMEAKVLHSSNLYRRKRSQQKCNDKPSVSSDMDSRYNGTQLCKGTASPHQRRRQGYSQR